MCESFSKEGDYIYIGDAYNSFDVIDVSDPSNPVRHTQGDMCSSSCTYISGSYLYLTGTCGGGDDPEEDYFLNVYDVTNPISPLLISEYEDYPSLNLGAITDGARNIRLLFEQVFGQPVTLILDWYHLRKKCYELMCMIARNKAEKETHIQVILAHLWQGQTNNALAYLQSKVLVRNSTKFEELLTYLQKHASEIINYEKRQLSGKTIGSGRMEKGVDQTIGHRQKRKGLSWRDLGSRALGLLKMVELNHQWHTLWVF